MHSTAIILFVAISYQYLGSISTTRTFYTAAVFEHAVFGTRKDPPKLIVDKNLAFYSKAAEIAKSKGADIIVYPEYGIFPAGSRNYLKQFLETAPDPRYVVTNPCLEEGEYLTRPILYTLSCIARKYSVVIVANTGDLQKCPGEPDCPKDGVFQYNTNVVFDRNGTLILKYHKEHLFFESGMDLPKKVQNTTFVTDFGKFATYICFDIVFKRMSDVARASPLDGVAFPTLWVDMAPQMTSIQIWQSWSIANLAPLLAANNQKPGAKAIGSGIFHGKTGALGYTFNPDGISKLLVSNVPKIKDPSFVANFSITAITEDRVWNFTDDGKDVPEICSPTRSKLDYKNATKYSCLQEDLTNYTLTKLVEPSGHLEICNKRKCCSLDYEADGVPENFYFGAFNGTLGVFNTYYFGEENCILTNCGSSRGKPCSVFPLKSDTVFRRIHLRGNFSTDVIEPSVVESGMRLVPLKEWSHRLQYSSSSTDMQILFENQAGRKITTVGLLGRCFDKDLPYPRKRNH